MESPSPFCLCKCQNTCIFLFLNFVILLFNIPSKLGMAPNRQLPINSVPYFLSIKNKQSVYQLLNYICESVDALCQVFVLSIINQKKIFINLHLQFQTFSWAPDKYLQFFYVYIRYILIFHKYYKYSSKLNWPLLFLACYNHHHHATALQEVFWLTFFEGCRVEGAYIFCKCEFTHTCVCVFGSQRDWSMILVRGENLP